ncbi:hypothetical protein MMC21_004132 [Puttea exsequens]|nr:hypothetical protein [Puttea exsequens]
MSQGPSGSRPPTGYIDDDRSKRLPPPIPRGPPIQNPTPTESPVALSISSAPQNAAQRPPFQVSTPPDQRSSRPIGVQNLLNPASSGDSGHVRPRPPNGDPSPSTGTIQRTRSPAPALSQPPSSMTTRSPVSVSLPSISQAQLSTFPQTAARAMTPRGSPSIYQPGLGHPSHTQNQPSYISREASNAGQGSYAPEMARIPSMQGDSHPSSIPASRSPPRRGSQDASRYKTLLDRTGNVATGSYPTGPQSDSPSTQYSSYSQVTRTPPGAAPPNVPTGQPQSFFTNPFTASGPVSSMAPMTFDGSAASGATAGSSYQMMTLDTENGPIQVPVDVQAASKVADEKRKRNATASHRFRQRRKEKERETSQSIARLEQQIRELEEEREHYHRERDYFREIAVRNPGQTHALPRPISPRQRRHTSMGGQINYGNLEFEGPESGNRSAGRNTRRRTSNYVPPTGPPPQVTDQPPLPPYDRQHLPKQHSGGVRHLQDPASLRGGPFNPTPRQ